jgi:hypothetical protein
LVFLFILILFALNIPSVSFLFIALVSRDFTGYHSRNWISGFGFLGAEVAVLFIPWYGILVSLLRKIRFKKKPLARTDLEECLKDEEAYKMFKKFASSEWSIENIYFIEDLENLKKETSKKFFENMSTEILKTYIFEDSPLEINISRTNRKDLILDMKKLTMENVGDVFRSVENEVYWSLKGTFDRFQRTEKYIKWKKNSKRVIQKIEVMEGISKTSSNSPNTIRYEESDLNSTVGSDVPLFEENDSPNVQRTESVGDVPQL